MVTGNEVSLKSWKECFLKRKEYAIIETGENVIENSHYQCKVYLSVDKISVICFFLLLPRWFLLIRVLGIINCVWQYGGLGVGVWFCFLTEAGSCCGLGFFFFPQ